MFLLKKGSILYRVTDKFENYIPNYDSDTGKTGLYFANYQALSLGMVLEYKREKMIFCTYTVIEDINILSLGKYNFRDLMMDMAHSSGYVWGFKKLKLIYFTYTRLETFPASNCADIV